MDNGYGLSLIYLFQLCPHTLGLGREPTRVEKVFSCWYSLDVFWNLKTWLLPCSRDVGTVLHRMRSPEQLTRSGHGLQRRLGTLASSRIVNGGLPLRLSSAQCCGGNAAPSAIVIEHGMQGVIPHIRRRWADPRSQYSEHDTT